MTGITVEETNCTVANGQESALDTVIGENGICWEASDEDTNTATYHLTSFNKRDIQAQNCFDRYTFSGSTDEKLEPDDNIQTERSENGTTNDITTPGSTDGKREDYNETFVKEKTAETEQSENGKTNDMTTPNSGSADEKYEPDDNIQTERSENGTTNDITTPVGSTDVKREDYNETFVKEKTAETEQSENGKTNDMTTPNSGSTYGKREDYNETFVKEKTAETEESENGKTNDMTTPNSDCVQKTSGKLFTSLKDNATEYMWLPLTSRVGLVTNSMSYNKTAKKKQIKKQIATRWTSKGNGIFIWRCLIWSLLSTTPIAALPRPPLDKRMNLFSSEYMKLDGQRDMNVQGEACRPQMSAKTSPADDFQQIECETSTCTSISRITFEKTSMGATQEWISVFEVDNKSNYRALNTNSEYTLKNRALFSSFPAKHLLYIQPLRLDDRGKWRCVVYNTNNIRHTSMSLFEIDSIYIKPTDGNINIRSQHKEIVTGQATELTCVVDGVFPKPEVMWEVNGIYSVSVKSFYRERGDKLWSMENIANLTFDKKGENNVTCKIKTDKRNPWVQQKLTIDVKEAAAITIPHGERTILLQDNLMINFECVGSGYKPNINWTKDGDYILEGDSRYQLKSLCNESTCVGSIETYHVDAEFGCNKANSYSGVYSCVISLKEPYNSTAMSPKFNVKTPDLRMCSQMFKNYDLHVGLIIGFSVLSVVLVIVAVLLCIMIIEQRRQVRRTMNQSNEQEGAKMMGKTNGN